MNIPKYPKGSEPEHIKKYLDPVLYKLDKEYPDKVITALSTKHKSLNEKIIELYKALGYEDKNSFLEAYGYKYDSNGGRPGNNYNEIIEELKKRYSTKAICSSNSQLVAENPDLASSLKTLANNSNKLFGKSLKDYFTEIGLIDSKSSRLSSDELISILTERYQTENKPQSMLEIIQQNPDLKNDISFYSSKAQAIWNTSLFNYLKSIGIIIKKLDKKALKKMENKNKYRCYKIKVEGIKRSYTGIFEEGILNKGDFVEVIFKDQRILPAQVCNIVYLDDKPEIRDTDYVFQITKKLFLKRFQYPKYELLMNEDQTILYKCNPYINKLTKIQIPQNVLTIKEEAFRDIEDLHSVELNNGLKIIEKNAFSKTDISKVTIPDSVEYIGEYAFSYGYFHSRVNVSKNNKHFRNDKACLFKINDDGSEEVLWCFWDFYDGTYVIPEKVKVIKQWAFAECKVEKLILNEGLEIIEDNAFVGTFIESLTLPSTLKEMGNTPRIKRKAADGPFWMGGDYGLINIIPNKNPNFFIEDNLMYKKIDDGYELIQSIKEKEKIVVKEGTTQITKNIFNNYKNTKEIILPNTLKTIKCWTFYDCGIEEIKIPDSVETIESGAFQSCHNLQKVILPKNLKNINYFPYYNIDSTLIDSYNIFQGCEKIKSIEISAENPYFCVDDNIIYNKNKTIIFYVPSSYNKGIFIIPKDIEDITSAFAGTERIRKIVLNDKITKINDRAFYNCSIQEFVIPSNVTFIHKKIFESNYRFIRKIITNKNSYAEEFFKNKSEFELEIIN